MSPTFDKIRRWLTFSRLVQSDAVRVALVNTSFERNVTIVAGLISTLVTAILACRSTGASWPYLWLFLDTCLVASRLLIIASAWQRSAIDRERSQGTLMALGWIWVVVFGCASGACVYSGKPGLMLMAGINVSGAILGVATRNAAFPRYGLLVMVSCAIPFVIGLLASRVEGDIGIASCIPLLVGGVYSSMLQNHRQMVRLFGAETRAVHMARTDYLTGLSNRIVLSEQLTRRCAALGEGSAKSHFSVLCIDLDGFKNVNDRYGHLAGDHLLAAVAGRLIAALRDVDLVCRVGGDEFVAMLPETSSSEAALVAQRIVSVLSQSFNLDLPTAITIGASVGVATAGPNARRPDDLLAEADRALYAAKKQGKARYVSSLPHHEAKLTL